MERNATWQDGAMSETLLTPEEVAEQMKLHPVTVRRMLRDGELPGIKIGKRQWRIPESALQQFIQRQLTPAAKPAAIPKSKAAKKQNPKAKEK